jgi:hypothetical protein
LKNKILSSTKGKRICQSSLDLNFTLQKRSTLSQPENVIPSDNAKVRAETMYIKRCIHSGRSHTESMHSSATLCHLSATSSKQTGHTSPRAPHKVDIHRCAHVLHTCQSGHSQLAHTHCYLYSENSMQIAGKISPVLIPFCQPARNYASYNMALRSSHKLRHGLVNCTLMLGCREDSEAVDNRLHRI